jgi:hypothetical protein
MLCSASPDATVRLSHSCIRGLKTRRKLPAAETLGRIMHPHTPDGIMHTEAAGSSTVALWSYWECYTRPTPSCKLILEYNILLRQKLASHPLVLAVLHRGRSSFARVTNELPLEVLWLPCVAGTSFVRSTAQLGCPPLSLPTQLSESKAAAYIDNPAALPL